MSVPNEPTMAPHFANGYDAGRGGPSLSPGLEAQGARWSQAALQSATRPQSVLHQIGLSPVAQNASAPDMEDRFNAFTGTVLPNLNTGASETTAQTALKLKFAGDEGEV
jgi:hypothetical protein